MKIIETLTWILLLMLSSCESNGVRSFYCLSEDKCITVWKKGDNEVYIIPFKYEKNKKPDASYLKTINKEFLTLYYSKELPNKIVVRDEGNLVSNNKMFSIENKVNGEWEFLEYSDRYKVILYKLEATRFEDIKLNADYLILNIQENYATDKTGKKVEQ